VDSRTQVPFRTKCNSVIVNLGGQSEVYRRIQAPSFPLFILCVILEVVGQISAERDIMKGGEGDPPNMYW
jgi:hypothetical protein